MKSSLILRMAVFLFVLLFGTFGAIVIISLNIEKNQLMSTVISDALQNSDIIRASTRYSMLQNQKENLHRIIDDISDPAYGVVKIRYYGKDSSILYSTKKSEIGDKVDMNSEACAVCHHEKVPPPVVEDRKRIRIFTAPEGYRVIGMISPIENEPDCYTAACHFHPADSRILGVLDMQMSLAEVDHKLSAISLRVWVIVAILAPLLAFAGGMFIYRYVYLRIKELIAGTREITKGHLDFRFDITSTDEISVLAESFNEMTRALQEAQEENVEWSQELQARVDEKTEELREAYAHLIEVEKMVSLGKLSATVAHELNNPLSGILTYLKVIHNEIRRDDNFDPERSKGLMEDIDTVIKETKRCGNIVKNLLIFARHKTDRLEKFDINAVIEHGLRMVNHHFEMKQLGHAFEVIPGDPEIEGDPDLIEQAMLALFINAVEAMDTAGGEIAVVLDLSGVEEVLVEVRDTGSGIQPDKLNNIFKPFYSTKDNKHSTGLGLAVVYGIVKRHGGRIRVESAVGEGTSFFITLPRQVDLDVFNKDQVLAPGMVPDKDEI